MKLLLDMNLSPRWVAVFDDGGIEAIHWSQIGPNGAPDVQIMNYARQHGLVVLTHDLDFGAILAATQGRAPSVVQIRTGDVSPDANSDLIIAALQKVSAELDAGALVTIENRTEPRPFDLVAAESGVASLRGWTQRRSEACARPPRPSEDLL